MFSQTRRKHIPLIKFNLFFYFNFSEYTNTYILRKISMKKRTKIEKLVILIVSIVGIKQSLSLLSPAPMTAKPGDAIMNFSHSYHIYLHYYQLVLNGKYPKTNYTAKLSSTSVGMGMGTGVGVGTPTHTQPQSFHSWLLSSHFSCDS